MPYPIILALVVLFLMGFLPEILLLNLDDWWKLLGLAYPVAAFLAVGSLLSGAGTEDCSMFALGLFIMVNPFFVGIAAAAIPWMIAFLMKKLSEE